MVAYEEQAQALELGLELELELAVVLIEISIHIKMRKKPYYLGRAEGHWELLNAFILVLLFSSF